MATPEARIAALASAMVSILVCMVIYQQNRRQIDELAREIRGKFYRLEDWAKSRPWPGGKLWEDVKDAANPSAKDVLDAIDEGAIDP